MGATRVRPGAGGIVCSFVFLAAGTAAAADSAMFRGDPAHSGVYAGAGVARFGKVKWQFHTGGRVISSPAVAGGTAYVGSTDGFLYAIDVGSGAEKWKFHSDARITSSPAVAGDAVYFGSYDGNFYALDATSGALKWKFQTAGERRFAGTHLHGYLPAAEAMPDPFDVYLSSPVLANGAVFFGSGDGNVYSLDARSGALKWKFPTGNVVHSSPAYADGTIFVGSWDSYFYALDAASGRQRWRFKTGDDNDIHNQTGIQGSPAVVDGTVYFGCRDNNLYALDARSGEKKWSIGNDDAWVIASPAVRNGKVYYATGDTALLRVVDAKSGKPIASLAFSWYFFASPAIAGELLYAANWDGKLTAVDLASFKPAWVFQTDASRQFLATFLQPDGKMKFRAKPAEHFYDELPIALDAIYRMGSMLSSPVIADGVIYVGSTDGNLYALM